MSAAATIIPTNESSNETTTTTTTPGNILDPQTNSILINNNNNNEILPSNNNNNIIMINNKQINNLNNNNNSINTTPTSKSTSSNKDTVFTLKRWNLVAMWSWDVECEVCAICRTPLMDSCLKCQTDNRHDDCVVVWGDCNHSFHNCCMSQWIKSRNLCPLCQSEWHVQRIGR